MLPRGLLRDRSGYQGCLGTALWERLSRRVMIDVALWGTRGLIHACIETVRQIYYCNCISVFRIYLLPSPYGLGHPTRIETQLRNRHAYRLVLRYDSALIWPTPMWTCEQEAF